MITLAMDTSCMTGGVAVLDGRRVLAEYSLSVKRTHSERLMSSVARVMEDASLKPSDIGLIACCTGPGSFTGIRIGVASAKAMGMALGAAIVPVMGLDALAYGLAEDEHAWCMIDARHENCYAARYVGTGGAPRMVQEPTVMTIAEMAACVRAEGLRHRALGDATLLYGEKLASESEGLFVLPTPEDAGIRPAKVAMLGLELYERGLSVAPAELAPFYIKHSEAEIKAEIASEGKCPSC
jgi:tRNA threonylcarbamoyladenosine biosynthesis protein TsaB